MDCAEVLREHTHQHTLHILRSKTAPARYILSVMYITYVFCINTDLLRSIYLSITLYVCLPDCLCVCVSLCPIYVSACQSVSMYVYLSAYLLAKRALTIALKSQSTLMHYLTQNSKLQTIKVYTQMQISNDRHAGNL